MFLVPPFPLFHLGDVMWMWMWRDFVEVRVFIMSHSLVRLVGHWGLSSSLPQVALGRCLYVVV